MMGGRGVFGYGVADQEIHWISTSDLMAGLMVVFLFISVALMVSRPTQGVPELGEESAAVNLRSLREQQMRLDRERQALTADLAQLGTEKKALEKATRELGRVQQQTTSEAQRLETKRQDLHEQERRRKRERQALAADHAQLDAEKKALKKAMLGFEKAQQEISSQAQRLKNESHQIRKIVVDASDTQEAIYRALTEEFDKDLLGWNAELVRDTLTMRFKEPDVLFMRSSAQLRKRFQLILADFFPRYVHQLSTFHNSIAEVRIEGHTSSEWGEASTEQAYFQNMELSQERTREVLKYCYSLPGIVRYGWLKEKIAAVGFSSSRPVSENGREMRDRSRRVEFSVMTNFEKRIIDAVVGRGT